MSASYWMIELMTPKAGEPHTRQRAYYIGGGPECWLTADHESGAMWIDRKSAELVASDLRRNGSKQVRDADPTAVEYLFIEHPFN